MKPCCFGPVHAEISGRSDGFLGPANEYVMDIVRQTCIRKPRLSVILTHVESTGFNTGDGQSRRITMGSERSESRVPAQGNPLLLCWLLP